MNTVRITGTDINGNEKSYFILDEDKEELRIVPKRTEKQKRLLNDKSEFNAHQNKLGGFVNVMFINNKLLFDDILNPQDTFRFIYLSTYLDYNNNMLVKKYFQNTKYPINKKEIAVEMGLTRMTFNRFWDNLIENNFIYEVEDKVYVNPEYFIKGEVPKDNNKEYSRIYIDTIKKLYCCSEAKNHRSLGYIMKLLPKMNYKTNFIVHNPNEDNISNLLPYSLKEICEELHLSTNEKCIRDFYKNLNKATIKLEGKIYKVFTRVTVDDRYNFYLINPLVAYKGKYMSDINKMLELLVTPMTENDI